MCEKWVKSEGHIFQILEGVNKQERMLLTFRELNSFLLRRFITILEIFAKIFQGNSHKHDVLFKLEECHLSLTFLIYYYESILILILMTQYY